MKAIPQHPLKIWRQSQKPPLSQRKLAHRLKTTDMSVCRWEGGSIPLFPMLTRIKAVTGITADELIEHRAILERRKKEKAKNGDKIETGRV